MNNVSEKLEQLAVKRLQQGLSFSEAGNISQQQMQELFLTSGADPLMVGGWMRGFMGEAADDKYKDDDLYVQGYSLGSEARIKLGPKFLN